MNFEAMKKTYRKGKTAEEVLESDIRKLEFHIKQLERDLKRSYDLLEVIKQVE